MSEKERKTGGSSEPEARESEGAVEEILRIVTAVDVEAAVRGASFPTTARELIERARQNGAENQVLDRIAELADRRLSSLGDALRQLDMLS